MKKVKYLLGFVFGLGFLVNQSFGYYNEFTFIDTVVPLGNYTSSSTSARYSYKFQNYGFSNNICVEGSCGSSNPFYDYFGYSVYYNGTTYIDRLPYTCDRGYCDDSKFGQYYNNSAYYLSPYTGRNYMNSYYVWSVNKNGPYGPISTYFGTNNNFGSVFLSVGDLYGNNVTKSPKYGFGKGFFDSANFIKADGITYARLFYPYINNGDDTYTNPVNGFNLTTMSGSTQTGSYAREYFYPRGTRTNYGYIVDDGTYYTKFKHFGLFQMGYSYVYLKVTTSDADDISWGDLKFRTVSDSIQIALQGIGDVDYNTFNYYAATGNINLSYNGILTVPVNSYVSWTNDDGVFLFSKDITNSSRVLYEHWSCNVSNIDLLINNATGCVKLDAGYLTYGGSTEVLPFSSFNTVVQNIYDVVNSEYAYPLLLDLLVGDTTKDNLHGYVEFGNNNSCVYINQKDRCYGFVSNASVDILENFLNPAPEPLTPDEQTQQIIDLCNNNSAFYAINIGLCKSLGAGGDSVVNSGTEVVTVCTRNENGLIICYNTTVPITRTGDYRTGSDGQPYWIDTGISVGIVSSTGGLIYSTGYLDSGGILSGSYFDNFFDSDSLFFNCPYPNVSNLGFVSNFKIGNFYPFMPLDCFISAFRYGKSVDYFNDFGVFNGVTTQPIINGTSNYHLLLYRFFDSLLSLGLIFLFLSLFRIFK